MSSWDEYKLFLEHIDKITGRRPGITTTYISVNTVIMGAITFIMVNAKLVDWGQQIAILGLLASGIIACSLWRRLITQYKILLDWWYTQIRSLEDSIPNANKLITKEYQELYGKLKGHEAIGLTKYEQYLTWLFTLIYVAFSAVVLILLII